jgi:hypothetical protein
MTKENPGNKGEEDPLDATRESKDGAASDLTEPLNRTPTAASQTTSAATEPTRATPAAPPMLSKTNPELAVPVSSTAGRSPTPEYKPPANAQ